MVLLHGRSYTQPHFSPPDGTILISGGPDGRIERWEVATGRPLPGFADLHESGVVHLVFSDDGGVFATGDRNGVVLVRDAAEGRIRHRLVPPKDCVALLAIARDGRTAILEGRREPRFGEGLQKRSTFLVWDVTSNSLLRELEDVGSDTPNRHSIALSPDAEFIAVGGEYYEIVVRNLRIGEFVAKLKESQDQDIQPDDPGDAHDQVACLAFSPDGKTLASAGRDASVRLWDVSTWSERVQFDWREGHAEAVAFSPDGGSLVAAGSAGVIRVWALPECRFGLKVDAMPFDEAGVAEEAGEPLTTRRARNRHKHGRQQLPEHLPRIEIEHDLADDEKPCPCCGEVCQRIGKEVSEQLEYLPASFKVLQHVRHVYACKRCETTAIEPQIQTAAKPPQPIDKGLAGPGLLAYVITSKLGDHLPLYRLEHIFERSGVSIARSTMCAWLQAAAELVQPLVSLMADRVRLSRVIHADETVVPVQAPGTGRCRKGRIWAYIGDRENPYVVYHYTPDRTRVGPSGWLENYKGTCRPMRVAATTGSTARGT